MRNNKINIDTLSTSLGTYNCLDIIMEINQYLTHYQKVYDTLKHREYLLFYIYFIIIYNLLIL